MKSRARTTTVAGSDEKLELRYIPVKDLFVDRKNYQRELKPVTLKKFDAGWDKNACGVLVVGPRPNGKFAIADGSHRWTKAKEFGIEELPCIIIDTHGATDEAGAFYKINKNRGNTGAYDVLRSLATYGDPDAINIARIVTRNGFELSPFNAQNRIVAAHALMRSYDTYGPECVDKALKLLRDVWDGEPASLQSAFILGAARWFYYAKPRTLHYDDFVSKLSRRKPEHIYRLMPDHIKSASQRAAIALNTVYNEKRRIDRVPNEAFEKQSTAQTAATKIRERKQRQQVTG